MNCAEVQELLSAHYDNELDGETGATVSEHLRQCPQCSEGLARFEQLSMLTRGLRTPQPPESTWHRLRAELDEEALSRPQTRHWYSSFKTPTALALAATILVTLGLGWLAYGTWFAEADHPMFAADFGQYLEEFHRDPGKAQQLLVAKYNGKAVDSAQAIQLVGYQPATAGKTHNEYKVKSMHVLEMPCCTCVQTVCERSDGSTVAIFEHDDENPQWFGDQPGAMANCSGKRCRLFDVNDRIAASWKSGTRHITVVGARDAADVSGLVTWLEGHQRGKSS